MDDFLISLGDLVVENVSDTIEASDNPKPDVEKLLPFALGSLLHCIAKLDQNSKQTTSFWYLLENPVNGGVKVRRMAE